VRAAAPWSLLTGHQRLGDTDSATRQRPDRRADHCQRGRYLAPETGGESPPNGARDQVSLGDLLGEVMVAARVGRTWAPHGRVVAALRDRLYLPVILDLLSGRVVGWATSRNVDRRLALAALDMALTHRRPTAGLVHHSDRGSTYASGDYRTALKARGIQCSSSRKETAGTVRLYPCATGRQPDPCGSTPHGCPRVDPSTGGTVVRGWIRPRP